MPLSCTAKHVRARADFGQHRIRADQEMPDQAAIYEQKQGERLARLHPLEAEIKEPKETEIHNTPAPT